MVRDEVRRRFGEAADVIYHDVSSDDVRADFASQVARIEEQGLLYPVTFIDDEPVYDGVVSYPMILRAVQGRIDSAQTG